MPSGAGDRDRLESPSHLALDVRASDAERAEWASAEAFEAGASGVEEAGESDGCSLRIYVPVAQRRAVIDAVTGGPACRVLAVSDVPDTDWSEAWREGLEVIEVSPRLRVRPSFLQAAPLSTGQRELIIDPAQAFGTGAHESTRLALECIDALAPLSAPLRMLDVGAGTGVLALAALQLGATSAVAFDLDPLAGEASRNNAAHNELGDRVLAFTGPIGALAAAPFDLVVANMLKRETLPILDAIVARLAPAGTLVLSGLLDSDRDEVRAALDALSVTVEREISRDDASGARWIGLIARAAPSV